MNQPGYSGDLVKSRVEMVAQERLERQKQRSTELAEQSSSINPPGIRIRTWEKLHGLNMPADPSHPVLDVIAVSTRLTLAQVQEEQRQRAENRRAPQAG